jgi:hypothetical protein
MYWILAIMSAIAAAIIALLVGGLVTPATYRVARRIHLRRHAHEVRALLADISAYEQWLPSATSLVPMAPGPTDAPDDAQGLTLQATDDDTRAQWLWSWEVHAGGAGADCRVTLTERGRVGNPVLRFVAALRGHGSHAERTLRALAEHCDEFDVAVEHVG